MRPKINVLAEVDGILQPITREMTEEEYADFLKIVSEDSEEE